MTEKEKMLAGNLYDPSDEELNRLRIKARKLATPMHPLLPAERNIRQREDGSVVTRDIPPHSLAAGNPCKVIRKITEMDRIEL